MHRNMLAIGSLIAACAASFAAAQPDAVRVPVAPPSITILAEGEPEPEWREPPVAPENEILLRGFGGPPPVDLEAAIDLLRTALPPDYLAELMQEFGYKRQVGVAPTSHRTDLREGDLAKFLFERWVDAAPETRLAREFSCLSWGEWDIGTFLTLLTHAEARFGEFRETWRLRRSASRHRIARESVQNARTAWARCHDLIGRAQDGK